ncbi:MAG: hypothetical protein ABI678_25885 [Kofleriaceae bacterium]
MNLVEAESTGPVEGDDPIVTPPRPRHRRVSVSLVLTLSVLIGLVVAIYQVFPARHNVLAQQALADHKDPPAWDLPSPTPSELRAWLVGAAGKDAPLPNLTAIGASRIDVLDRHAALIRFKIGNDEVSYVVGHAARIAPEHSESHDGDLRVVAWPKGAYVCAAVGPDASAATWLAALGGK